MQIRISISDLGINLIETYDKLIIWAQKLRKTKGSNLGKIWGWENFEKAWIEVRKNEPWSESTSSYKKLDF